MLAMKQVLEDGGSCVYVDFEDSDLAFYDRMTALGVDLRKVVLEEQRLGWSSPEIEPSKEELAKLLGYDLVVIDSWADMIGTFREGSLRDGILARRVCRLLRMLCRQRGRGGGDLAWLGEGRHARVVAGCLRAPARDDRGRGGAAQRRPVHQGRRRQVTAVRDQGPQGCGR